MMSENSKAEVAFVAEGETQQKDERGQKVAEAKEKHISSKDKSVEGKSHQHSFN